MPDEATIKRWVTKWGLFVLVAILGGIAREAKDRMDGRDFCARLDLGREGMTDRIECKRPII